jgi:hypothetical protein
MVQLSKWGSGANRFPKKFFEFRVGAIREGAAARLPEPILDREKGSHSVLSPFKALSRGDRFGEMKEAKRVGVRGKLTRLARF